MRFFNRIPQLGDAECGNDVHVLQSLTDKAMRGNITRGLLYIGGILSLVGVSVFAYFRFRQ